MTSSGASSSPDGARCSACGGPVLTERFAVAGSAGEAGLIPTTDSFGTALSDIVACESCGHMQLAEMPLEESLEEAYEVAASDDYVQEEAGQRETARRILARLESHVAPGRLLDLGCWVGFFPAEAALRGWDAVGVEPSSFAAGYARDRLGVDVIQAPLLEAELGVGAFDLAFMGDVIEHLVDPDLALARVRRALRPGGVLGLVLPDAGSRVARALGKRWWSVIPTHVQYFTRGSLATLLRRGGFEPLTVSTAPKAFSVGYYLARIGGYSDPLATVLVRLANSTGVGSRIWAPDFRDRMLMIARKKQ